MNIWWLYDSMTLLTIIVPGDYSDSLVTSWLSLVNLCDFIGDHSDSLVTLWLFGDSMTLWWLFDSLVTLWLFGDSMTLVNLWVWWLLWLFDTLVTLWLCWLYDSLVTLVTLWWLHDFFSKFMWLLEWLLVNFTPIFKNIF